MLFLTAGLLLFSTYTYAQSAAATGRLEGTITLMAPVARIAGREAELAQLTRAAADRISYKL